MPSKLKSSVLAVSKFDPENETVEEFGHLETMSVLTRIRYISAEK